MNADEEIAQLQRDWAEAVQQRDMAALEQLLGEEFTLTTGRKDAEVRRRQEWLDVTRESYEVDQWAYEEMDVRVYGDAAVVRSRYRQTARMGGADRTGVYLMTDVWVRRDGRWQAVTRHISPLEGS